MSKLTDLLSTLGQVSQTRLGFGPTVPTTRNPVMLIVGFIKGSVKGNRLGPALKCLDAIIISSNNAAGPPQPQLKNLADRIWGLGVNTANTQSMQALKRSGCDFLILETKDAPLICLQDNGMAKGFPIEIGTPDEQARALEDLPFDFLILDSAKCDWPLSVGSLIQIQSSISMVSKHIFMRVPKVPRPDEVQLLRDLPVSALILDIDSIDIKSLQTLRETVDKLEPRKAVSEHDHAISVHPHPPQITHQNTDDEGDEEWED